MLSLLGLGSRVEGALKRVLLGLGRVPHFGLLQRLLRIPSSYCYRYECCDFDIAGHCEVFCQVSLFNLRTKPFTLIP